MTQQDIEFEISSHFKSCIQLALSQLACANDNVSPWRWIVIALHDAIYCALVMKLSRTDLFGVFPDALEKKAGEFYSKGLSSRSPEWNALSTEQDQSKLADLRTLIKRADLPSQARIHNSISSTQGPSRDLSLLKKRRDMFVHSGDYSLFTTDGELKEICLGSVKVLLEIASLQGNRYFHLSHDECIQLATHLKTTLETCKNP